MERDVLNELYPIMASRLDEFFPEMEFKLSKGKWISRFKYHGEAPRVPNPMKCYSAPKDSYFSIHEQGEQPISYIDYQLEKMGYTRGTKGEPFKEALAELCRIAGIDYDKDGKASERAQKERERQHNLEDINNRMRSALYSKEGSAILYYLREVRHYGEGTDIDGNPVDLVRDLGLGYVTPELAADLKAAMGDLWNENTDAWGIGKKYVLSVPCRSNGKIVGFNFRAIDPGVSPKYVNTFKTGEKGKYLFGMSPISVHKASYKNLTIVEGEIDALHASVLGLSDVVAMGGSSVPLRALEAAREKGFENVTILLDNDKPREDPGEEEKRIARKDAQIRAFLEVAKEAGLRPYVADLPTERNQYGNIQKSDVDSYLLAHPVKDLANIIDSAPSGAKYLFAKILEKGSYLDMMGELHDKSFKALKDEAIDLIRASQYPEDRNYIKENLAATFQFTTGAQIITEKDIQDRIEELNRAEALATRTNKTREATQKAEKLARDGKTEEAIQYMEDALQSLNSIGQRERYGSLLNDNIEAIFEGYKVKPKSIETSFELGIGKDAYRLSLPSGAITIIGGVTGHGKSKMLQSLALDAAQSDGEGTVLYIPYEENKQNVIKQLLNSFADLELTLETAKYGNLQTITEYLYNGSTQYMKADKVDEFKSKIEAFKALYAKERIKVIRPEDNYLGTLVRLLKYAIKERQIKAVFIDYVQELYVEDNKTKGRVDELKEIMVEVDLIAQENNIPVIMGAQLRRETESPLSMANQDISDSGWIERKASEIVLLWSSKERCKNDKDGKSTAKVNKEIFGLDLGTKGRIYAKLTKSRLNATGVDAILEINGNTGRIQGNIGKPRPQRPENGSKDQKRPEVDIIFQ